MLNSAKSALIILTSYMENTSKSHGMLLSYHSTMPRICLASTQSKPGCFPLPTCSHTTVTSPKLEGERKPTPTFVLRQAWLECLAMSYLNQGRQRLLERRTAPQQKLELWKAIRKKAFKYHRWAITQHQEYRAKGLVSRAGRGPRL